MKLLVIGHSLIVDSNRKFWSVFAETNAVSVDLVCPSLWTSGLSKHMEFVGNPDTDSHLGRIIPLRTHFKGNGSLFFFELLGMWKVLLKQRYDMIYLNQETWALATFWVVLLKLFTVNRRTPLILCVAQNLKKERLRFLHVYERVIARFIKGFLYCSEEVKDVLRWKNIKNPCIYFPLPYDDKVYRPSLPSLGTDLFRIGYLGRLTEDKGLPLLLQVLDQLNAQEIKYPLVIGGNGPLASEVKKRRYVTYLGTIPHNQAQDFYGQIDCFVLASQTRPHWKEQFGRVIVEALAAGRPVIGSSSGSIPEVLAKVEWNWVFKEASAEELKEQVLKLQAHLRTEAGKLELARSIDLNAQWFSQSEVASRLFKEIRTIS